MENNDHSLRFSLAYVGDAKRVEDSKRASVRIASLFDTLPSDPVNPWIYAQQIALEIGVRVPINGNYTWNIFFQTAH